MMLALCWVAELRDAAARHRVAPTSRSTHPALIRDLAQHLSPGEITALVCRALRGRDCLWHADPPIVEPA